MISLVIGWMISWTETRPRIRSPNEATTLIIVLDFGAYKPAESTAVLLIDNNIMSNVHKTAGEISGIGSLQRGVGKTLRAPWVEMKYSSTERPSLKFAKIGFSIIWPPSAPAFWGLAIRPRMPAS